MYVQNTDCRVYFIDFFPFDQVADHPEQRGKYGCVIDIGLVGEKTWRMYTLSGVLVQYCIPLTVITFCHCHMAKVNMISNQRT